MNAHASSTHPLRFQAQLSGEDWARADFYGVLAQLFFAPPDVEFLGLLARSETADAPETPLAQAWRNLLAAAREAPAEDVRREYEDAFIGVGRPEVFLFGSFHMAGHLNEKPLVDLRDELARLGLAAAGPNGETEDHVAAVLEVMRYLITADDPALARVATQRQFFARFLEPWYERLADTIEGAGSTDFYKHVARLLRAFLDVEREAFRME